MFYSTKMKSSFIISYAILHTCIPNTNAFSWKNVFKFGNSALKADQREKKVVASHDTLSTFEKIEGIDDCPNFENLWVPETVQLTSDLSGKTFNSLAYLRNELSNYRKKWQDVLLLAPDSAFEKDRHESCMVRSNNDPYVL